MILTVITGLFAYLQTRPAPSLYPGKSAYPKPHITLYLFYFHFSWLLLNTDHV